MQHRTGGRFSRNAAKRLASFVPFWLMPESCFVDCTCEFHDRRNTATRNWMVAGLNTRSCECGATFTARSISGAIRTRCPSCGAHLVTPTLAENQETPEVEPQVESKNEVVSRWRKPLAIVLAVAGMLLAFIGFRDMPFTLLRFLFVKDSADLAASMTLTVGTVILIGCGTILLEFAQGLLRKPSLEPSKPTGRNRPFSVSVIAWCLAFGVVILLWQSLLFWNVPLSPGAQSGWVFPVPRVVLFAHLIIGACLQFYAAIYLYHGHTRGRWIYVGLTVIGLLFCINANPDLSRLLIALTGNVCMVFFLFRPKANAFFRFKSV